MSPVRPTLSRLLLSLLGAVGLLGPGLLLRAAADGPAPGVAVALGLGLAVAVAVWPFTARPTTVASGVFATVVSQLGLHTALVWIGTGSPFHPGALGSVCSPSTPATTVTDCGLATVTALGGPVLLGVQFLAAVAVGLLLAGADRVVITPLLSLPGHPGRALLRLVLTLHDSRVPAPCARLAPVHGPVRPLAAVWRTAAVGRRGPPVALGPSPA